MPRKNGIGYSVFDQTRDTSLGLHLIIPVAIYKSGNYRIQTGTIRGLKQLRLLSKEISIFPAQELLGSSLSLEVHSTFEVKKMKTTNIIVAFAVFALLTLAACVPSEKTILLKQEQAEQFDTIVVTGSSDMEFAPDQAESWLTIQNKATNAKDAQRLNSETADKVYAALQNAGVNKNEIETTSYTVYPVYEWDGERSVLRGYEVTNTIKLTTKDVENVGDYLDVAVNAGVNNVQNVQFTLSKDAEKKAKDTVLKAAGTAAREKAQSLASSVGVTVVKVRSISESSYNYQPPIYYARDMMAAAPMMEKSTPSISPEKVSVSASVTVTYEIGN